jgi:malate dehydrogenase (oxaloacetate-decarboxylating)
MPNSAAYSISLSLNLDSQQFSALTVAITGADAEIISVESPTRGAKELLIYCRDLAHEKAVAALAAKIAGAAITPITDRVFADHERGKMSIVARHRLDNQDDLARAYTPGVARPCMAIFDDPRQAANLTLKGNTVAVVSDGTAVLGLGDIGPHAALPVMEGKCLLFKKFADIDAVPLCLATKDVEEIVATVQRVAPTFGGINLEDISAPRCFEIEEKLKAMLDIPIFHDDQHGTAVVVLAGLINALKVAGQKKETARVVMSGVGAAGIAIAKMLLNYGFADIIMCNRAGIVNRANAANAAQVEIAGVTNRENRSGSLADALVGADIFIGVSAAGLVSEPMAAKMNRGAIIFALANPTPEIMPEVAAKYAAVVASGRSDYPNQINNVLAFPGIFRGALDAHASAITEKMKLAAALALAESVAAPTAENIMPSPFDRENVVRVAAAVAAAAREDNVIKSSAPAPTFADLRR